jgi:AcrR family transcriptional regulator
VGAREKILEAADVLFGEYGFEGASTRRIARHSGVNKALIHYHFNTKDDLFFSVLDSYYERLSAVLVNALGGEGSIRQRFRRLLDEYVDFLTANRNFSRIVQREASAGPHTDRITSHMVPIFRAGVAQIRQAFPATESGDLSAEHLLVSFYGMVVSWFTYSPIVEGLLGGNPLVPEHLEQRKAHVGRMLDLVLDGLSEEPTSEPSDSTTGSATGIEQGLTGNDAGPAGNSQGE